MKILSDNHDIYHHNFMKLNNEILSAISGYDKSTNIAFTSLGGERLTHEDSGLIDVIDLKYQRIIKNEAFAESICKELQKNMEQKIPEEVNISGSCMISTFVTYNEVTVFNLGDGRAFLIICDDLQHIVKVQQLNKLHNPDDKNPNEIIRVQKAGGIINNNRIIGPTGQLAISRALGDNQYNVNDAEIVSRVPDVTTYPIKLECGQRGYILLSCDGIAEKAVLSKKKSVENFIQEIFIDSNGKNPVELTKKIVTEAYQLGSNDNITTALIPIDAKSKKLRFATIFDGHGGRRPWIFSKKIPDKTELKAYATNYLFTLENIFYITENLSLEEISIADLDVFKKIISNNKKLNECTEITNLEKKLSKEAKRALWKIITVNPNHHDNEVAEFLENNFKSVLDNALKAEASLQQQSMKNLLSMAKQLDNEYLKIILKKLMNGVDPVTVPNPVQKIFMDTFQHFCLNRVGTIGNNISDFHHDLLIALPNEFLYDADLKIKLQTLGKIFKYYSFNYQQEWQQLCDVANDKIPSEEKLLNFVNNFFSIFNRKNESLQGKKSVDKKQNTLDAKSQPSIKVK